MLWTLELYFSNVWAFIYIHNMWNKTSERKSNLRVGSREKGDSIGHTEKVQPPTTGSGWDPINAFMPINRVLVQVAQDKSHKERIDAQLDLGVNRASTENASKLKERVHSMVIHEHRTHWTSYLLHLFTYIHVYCICLLMLLFCIARPLPNLTEFIWLTIFSFILCFVYIYDYKKMKLFESK